MKNNALTVQGLARPASGKCDIYPVCNGDSVTNLSMPLVEYQGQRAAATLADCRDTGHLARGIKRPGKKMNHIRGAVIPHFMGARYA